MWVAQSAVTMVASMVVLTAARKAVLTVGTMADQMADEKVVTRAVLMVAPKVGL